MVLLSNDEFLAQLTTLVQKNKSTSAFTVTLKRYDGHAKPTPRPGRPQLPQSDEYMCLIRAQSKSKKLSTIVHHQDVPKVMEGYAKFMKTTMDGLKKVKKIKSKAKAAQG